MLIMYIVAIIIAIWLVFESQKIDKVVSPRLIERDMNGVNTLFIFSVALLGFGVSGATVLYFGIVLFDVESFVFSVPVAVFIFLGFCSRRDDGYATRSRMSE